MEGTILKFTGNNWTNRGLINQSDRDDHPKLRTFEERVHLAEVAVQVLDTTKTIARYPSTG